MAPGLESDENEEWMTTLPTELWDIPLTNLAIPGRKSSTRIHSILKLICRVYTSQRANKPKAIKYRVISCLCAVHAWYVPFQYGGCIYVS